MKNTTKAFVIITFVAAIVLSLAGCSNPAGGEITKTPVAADFNISGLTQTEGSVTAVTITPLSGKSGGKTTIYYEGAGNTPYTKSTTVPTAAGTYTVTFDVAAAKGWKAASGLNAGTLTVDPAQSGGKTLVGIAVTAHPTKTQYNKNEDLDTAGMVVTATYSDNSTAAVTGYSVSGYDKTGIGNQTITVTYQGKTAEFSVSVIDPIKQTVAAPTADPEAGAAASGTTITLVTTTAGAEIWYTTNGNNPAKNGAGSTKYTAPFAITPPVTVKAVAVKDGWNDSEMLEATYTLIPIASAEITIIAPVKGGTPTAAATVEGAYFTAGTVTWLPTDSTFKGGTAYTATVTLTANNGYAFTDTITATINGQTATMSNNTGADITLSYAFAETSNKTVNTITIKTQPTKLAYTHGDALELAGLVVTLGYDDNTSEDVAATNFEDKGITAIPSNGNSLIHLSHNNQPVTVQYGSLTKTTNNLTVSAKAIDFTIDAIDAHEYTGNEIKPNVTVKDGAITLKLTDDYTVGYSNNTNAGTNATVNVTGAGNYTGSTGSVTFTISKANPNVSAWPSAATITYGAALSTSTLTGGSGTPAGTFAWTTGTTIPTVTNSGYSVTFTPTDSANYNTRTNTVSITVNKANPSVTTWPTAAAITYGAALSTSALTGGAGAGTFAWTDGTIKPTVTNSGYSVTFTPTDSANYNSVTQNVSIIVRLGVEMVSVSDGSFQMGKELGTAGSGDTTPVHTVTLIGFYMGKYPVTQKQYQAVMGSNPSSYYGVGDNYPVYYVSWYDAIVFCNKLSMAEGLTPAYSISGSTNPADWGTVPTSNNNTWNAVTIVNGSTGYRLPTEAQWEYAAKGGDPTASGWVGYTYAGSNTIGDVAWYWGNIPSQTFGNGYGTQPVGTKQPNGLGLYDMSGNVWEWCWDWYGDYTSEAQTDPTGAASGSNRVLRGGGWPGDASFARSVDRINSDPINSSFDIGFRLVRP